MRDRHNISPKGRIGLRALSASSGMWCIDMELMMYSLRQYQGLLAPSVYYQRTYTSLGISASPLRISTTMPSRYRKSSLQVKTLSPFLLLLSSNVQQEILSKQLILTREFLLSTEHISYCVQVIAMENYLDHRAPVYQEQPPQDPNTGT